MAITSVYCKALALKSASYKLAPYYRKVSTDVHRFENTWTGVLTKGCLQEVVVDTTIWQIVVYSSVGDFE